MGNSSGDNHGLLVIRKDFSQPTERNSYGDLDLSPLTHQEPLWGVLERPAGYPFLVIRCVR
jgi:hypothetical protein